MKAFPRFASLLAVATLTLAAVPLPIRGQDGSLSTSYGGLTQDEGFMFDVIATRPLTITGVQFAFGDLPLTDQIDVWFKPGSFLGSEMTEPDWTLIGSGMSTVSAVGAPSPVFFLSTPLTLPAGGQVGLYIQRALGAADDLTATSPGGQAGTVAVLDSNLLLTYGKMISGDFTAIGALNVLPNVTVHYTLTDLAAPTATIIGANRIRTTEKRQRIDGLATDDVGVASVKVRFKRQRNNGTTRNVTRFIPFDATTGLFRINVKTFIGRNPVRFTVTDTAGQVSPTAKAVIIRKE